MGEMIDEVADAHCARKAVGVDADGKERNLKRLRRIEGQVRGVQKMVGVMAFTVMPYFAHSVASCLVRRSTAALLGP